MIYEFMATQSFNGYDKPWAPGANLNVFPPPSALNPPPGAIMSNQNGIVSINVAAAGNCSIAIPDFTFAESGQKIELLNTFTNATIRFYNGDTQLDYFSLTNKNRVISAASLASLQGKTITKYIIQFNGENSGDIAIMVTADEEAALSAFSPYANICMPEGFNIWDPATQEYVQVYAGYVNANTRELYLRPVYKEYAGEELVGPWMSSLDPYAEDTTPTEGAFVIDFGGELTSYEITPFMLQTLLESLGIRQHFTDGAGLLNKLMDQAQGRVRSEEELLHLSRPLNVIAIGDQLPAGLTFKPISKDVLPGLPGKFIR